jgi:hypothetical protein
MYLRRLCTSATLVALVTLLFVTSFASAQLGGLMKHKDSKDKDKPAASAQAPELSDSDKKKLAEIEQRPEVKDRIAQAWEAKRRADLEFAFNVNTSIQYGPNTSLAELVRLRQDYGQLYNNPILQRYLNNIGQRVVPKDSPNLYSFKLLLDPVPRAEALSTGTVYVSTGLVSMLDNEAQLSYVLGHEIAHVERNHFYNQIRNGILEDELNDERAKDAEKKRSIFTAVATGIGAGIGGGFGGGRGALGGALLGFGGGALLSQVFIRNKQTVTEWSLLDENQADEAGFKYMLDQNYDAREVPKLYARLDNLVTRDQRVGLGFIGKLSRVKERTAHVQSLLAGTYKPVLEAKLKEKGLVGSSADFPLLTSALKRDNGIIALDYDLFAMGRDNLEEAVNLRSNDARAQLYLGKVMSMTARTPADSQAAESHFEKAIQYDEGRGAYPDPHLERAIHLIAQSNSSEQEEVRKELQTYVALYQREHAGGLPPNMPVLYDYFTLAGDESWYVPPAAVISTKNVDPLSINSNGPATALAAKEVVQNATAGAALVNASQSGNKNAPKPKVKPASSPAKP